MKDKSFIIFIIISLLIGIIACDPEESVTAKPKARVENPFFDNYAKVTKIRTDLSALAYTLYEVEYKGHEYILVSYTEGVQFKHLASCPCQKEKDEEAPAEEVEEEHHSSYWDF